MSAAASPMPKQEQLWSKSYPVDIDWNAEIPVKTMTEVFDESVKKYANRNCLHFLGRDISYKEVGEMVDKFAKGLQDQGFGKGSTVGICLPNTPYSVIAYYGAMKAGARVANFDPTSPAEALAQQINDSKTDVMVTTNLNVIQPNVDKALQISSMKKVIVCDFAQALPTVKKYAFKAIDAVRTWPIGYHEIMKDDTPLPKRYTGTDHGGGLPRRTIEIVSPHGNVRGCTESTGPATGMKSETTAMVPKTIVVSQRYGLARTPDSSESVHASSGMA